MITNKIIFIIIILMLFTCNKGNTTIQGSLPTVQKVTQFSVTINWTTQKSIKGSIQWKDSRGEEKSLIEKKASTYHVLTITGLLPEKVYTYSINTMANTQFTFRTAPKTGSPFRFCILNPKEFSISKITSFYPDFIILTENNDNLLKIRDLQTQIPFLKNPFQLEWGNTFINSNGEKEIIVIIKKLNKKNNSSYQTIFATYTDSIAIKVDTNKSISYVSTGSKTLCVEVQGDEIKAGFGDNCDKLEYLVKKGSLTFEKTCILCRRLLEKKHFKKSIEYYRRFINENPEQNLHDEALYQIAYIFDTYLFDFKKASEAYGELLINYPNSQLSQIAEIRLDYLSKHNDYEFKPLIIFEKHKQSYRSQKDIKSLDTIEILLNDYKDCSIKTDIILWLGTIYSQLNWKKAISYLELLTHDSIPTDIFWKAAFKIGTILYSENKFKKAAEYHRKLLIKFPKKSPELQVKIDRSVRNQRRELIFYCSMVLIVIILLITYFLEPRGYSLINGKSIFFIGCIYFLSGIIYIGINYEYLKSVIPFACTITILMTGVIYISKQLLYKLTLQQIPLLTKLLICSFINILLTFATIYICFKQFHYLFVLERIFQ